jgi:uncharacterized iron-regulated protein
MTPSMPNHAELHHTLKPNIRQAVVSGLLLLLTMTVLVFCVCDSASAGPGKRYTAKHSASKTTNTMSGSIPDALTDSLVSLPVVKLQQTDSLAQTMEQIDSARVVLVGETHTRWDHHLVQLEILKLLYQKSPRLAIGVEWFQQPFQQYLDAYVAGDISEKEMLDKTGYFERWRYDYRLYRPILQYAREHHIPVIALNASQELTTALRDNGFDELPAELKEQLPTSYDWSDKDYEKRLREIYEQHPANSGDFEQFQRGQLTWDESMAERAARFLKENPESRLLVLAGSGHIAYGSGIPNRIKRRIDVEQFSILVSEDALPVADNIADYLVLSAAQSLEPVGLIGALLETEGKLVVIKGFTDNSASRDAGLEKGMIIIKVDGKKVESFADFKVAIIDKKPGESVDLSYLENADSGSKDVKSINLVLR